MDYFHHTTHARSHQQYLSGDWRIGMILTPSRYADIEIPAFFAVFFFLTSLLLPEPLCITVSFQYSSIYQQNNLNTYKLTVNSR